MRFCHWPPPPSVLLQENGQGHVEGFEASRRGHLQGHSGKEGAGARGGLRV